MKKQLNIIGHRRIFVFIAVFLVLISLISIFVFGFRTAIEFSGGTMWQIKFDNPKIANQEISDLLKIQNVNAVVTQESSGDFILRLPETSESEHQKLIGNIKEKLGNFEELRFESLSPSIGKELKNKSIWAMILVLLGISFYVAWAFRKVSHPLKSWKYGVVVLASLLHDVAIPSGAFSLFGHFFNIEIDPTFIAAILAVMGFSVHDTIVVFDRVRENLTRLSIKSGFDNVVNQSVNETIVRSINTSLTVVLVLLAIYFLGPVSLHNFSLALLIGTVAGAYSSIFVASPLLVDWYNRGRKKL